MGEVTLLVLAGLLILLELVRWLRSEPPSEEV